MITRMADPAGILPCLTAGRENFIKRIIEKLEGNVSYFLNQACKDVSSRVVCP